MFVTARRTIAVAATAALLPLTGAATANAVVTAPYGTAPVTVTHAGTTTAVVTGIRSARHVGFDRLVVQFAGRMPSYDIRYVPHLYQDGSGNLVSLAGARDLQIRLDDSAAHRTSGASSLTTASHRTPLNPALREWKLIGDFEGVVTIGAGIRETLAYRVSELSSPRRLVIDVQHPLPAPTSTAAKTGAPIATTTTHLTSIRVATHATYERVVFQFDGRAPGYNVRYVPVVYADASGAPVSLNGTAFLNVSFNPAAAHRDDGTSTYSGSRDIKRSTGQVREVELTGDFEAVLSFGIGVHSKAGFRVLRLPDPTRIAIDIAR
ncbi:MAG: Peptidoglycan-binding domain 1 protein [Frankiales bacterium]|nr:Peptidoglycan-binding domain 1 protein [Frankiales bacterium]